MAFGISWLKPEIDQFRYWVHLFIVSTIIVLLVNGLIVLLLNLVSLNISQFVTNLNVLFNLKFIFIETLTLVPITAIADTIAHTLLQMD